MNQDLIFQRQVGNKRRLNLSKNVKNKIFFLFYCLLILILLIGIEIILRITNYGINTEVFLRKKVNGIDLYILNPYFINKYYPAAKNRFKTDTKEFFTVDKKNIRGFVLGESTAEGFPYFEKNSFSEMLKLGLRKIFNSNEIDVINLAFSAVTSYCIKDMAKALKKYKPDFIVIYAGHNEYYGLFGDNVGGFSFSKDLNLFLKNFKIFQFLFNIFEKSNKFNIGKDNSLMEIVYNNNKIDFNIKNDKRVSSNFIRNIDTIIKDLLKENIKVILIEPVSNLIDMPPFSGKNDEKYKDFIKEYVKTINSKDINLIESFYKERLKIKEYNDNANIVYLDARIKQILGDPSFIKDYIKAKDLDLVPFRARSTLIEDLREYVRTHKYPNFFYINTFDELASEFDKSYSIFGDSIFLDHLHFNNTGNRFLTYIILKNFQKIYGIDKDLIDEKTRDLLLSGKINESIYFTPLSEVLAYYRINGLIQSPPFSKMIIKYKNSLEKSINKDPNLYEFEKLFKGKSFYNVGEVILDLIDNYNKNNNIEKSALYANFFNYIKPTLPITYIVQAKLLEMLNDLDEAEKAYIIAYNLSDNSYLFFRYVKIFYYTFYNKESKEKVKEFIKKYGDYRRTKRITSPHKLMQKILELHQVSKFEEIYNYIYDIVEIKDKVLFSSAYKMVEGMKKVDLTYDFSFSPVALKMHLDKKYIKKYTVKGNDYLVWNYLIQTDIYKKDDYLKEIVEKKRYRDLLFYVNDKIVLIFIKEKGNLKLLFLRNLLYCKEYNKKNQKLDWTKEEKIQRKKVNKMKEKK